MITRRHWFKQTAALLLTPALSAAPLRLHAACPALLSHPLRPLLGGDPVVPCEHWQGRVLLVVNTASRCGFTPQFEGLEALHQAYADRGLQVLGVPSDDFRQELDDEREIAAFCELNYGVSFPMFSKSRVRGPDAHPFYRALASAAGGEPGWNFYKYLVSADGQQVMLFPSSVTPQSQRLRDAIDTLLERT